jgi:Flp pilus assembly protein TadG
MAAVEFALILPIMVAFYFGLVGLTVGVMQDRKVTLMTRTVADLAGRLQGAANATEIDTIVGAAGNVLAPYDPNGIEIVVASVAVRGTGQMDAQGKPIVTSVICWSAARSVSKVGNEFVTSAAAVPGKWAKGKPYPTTLPGGFDTANTSFIQTAVTQEYKPVIGKELLRYVTYPSVDSITLQDQMPWPVRNVREVVWEGQPSCLPPG